MKSIDPAAIPATELHQILLGAVAPRPIALASTVDANGRPNLSPFSFYNAFGVNPSTIIFSPSRRGRDNTVKNTYENVKEVPEVVINAVTYRMVQQVSLASSEFPKGVNEFVKSGLTPLPSEKIRPYRVSESPVQFECRVRQVIETGDGGGAANLVVCEILLIHLDTSILNDQDRIDTRKIDLVGRMGGDFYVRATGDALFEVEKPLSRPGIGVDQLPEHARFSHFLSGNDLGRLGNLGQMPSDLEIEAMRDHHDVTALFGSYSAGSPELIQQIHLLAKKWIERGEVNHALCLLMLI